MKRFLQMLALVLAGEMIFSLPFHTARFFRPTFLDAFGFSNTQLGDAFAVYGVTAMLAYFPGGLLADRFPARKLMALSLLATAAGGLFMATLPGFLPMTLLYGYWGITTIFLFWAAMIRATRTWGGSDTQGIAFGILDGGRGLVAAGFAMFAVAVLAAYLPAEALRADSTTREEGMRKVILVYTAATAACALLAWFLLPDPSPDARSDRASAPGEQTRSLLRNAGAVLRQPLVWAQAAVIVCAYSAYKGLDNYALYAVQVLGMDELEAARLTAWASYLRPVAAVLTGLLADRILAAKALAAAFAALLATCLMLAWSAPGPSWSQVIYGNVFVSFFAVFALRGVYFALLEETGTPRHLTGATVGAVSFIGYTPEIFFGPVSGRILDRSPGLEGHQDYFLFLGLFAVAGLAVSVGLSRVGRRWNDAPPAG